MKMTFVPVNTDEKYQALLREMSEGFAVLEAVLNPFGNVVDLVFRESNVSFERLAGIDHLEGRSIFDVIPAFGLEGLDLARRTLETAEPTCIEVRASCLGQPVLLRFLRFGEAGARTIGMFCRIISACKTHDEALRKIEERFLSVAGQSGLGVAMFDREQRLTFANEAYATMYGKVPDDLVGLPVEKLTVPEDWRRKSILLDGTLSKGEAFTIDKRHARHDGKLIWVRSCVGALHDDAGNIVGGAITSVDVTDLKQAELTKRQLEDRYKLLFNSIDHGFCVVELIFDGNDQPLDYRILEINSAFEEQTGLRNAVGRTARELEPGLEPYWFEIYGRVAKTGIPERFELPAEKLNAYYEVYAFRIGLAEAGQVGILFNDVAERIETQNAIREAEVRFRQFGDASSDVIWIRNAETLAVEYSNPAFEHVYGFRTADLSSGNGLNLWLQSILTEDRSSVEAAFDRVRKGEALDCVYRLVRRSDGQVRWIKSTLFPLRDARERIQRIGGIGRDITEERQTTNRHEVLVSELQHRTRNLLAVTRALAGKTLRASRSLEEFGEIFSARLEALERVNALLARLGEGDRISFDELVDAELDGLGISRANGRDDPRVVLAGPRGVRLRSGTVQTFALALHELMTNAVKYGALSRPEGQLCISWTVERIENCARLKVRWEETGAQVDGADVEGIGYGRELIERALPYQLGAETSYDLGPDGLHCTIVMPISVT